MQPKVSQLPERIRAKIDLSPSGCWEWNAGKTNGYGMLWWEGKMNKAMIIVWNLLMGPHDQAVLDHYHCDNPPCVNPAHLRPSTQRANTLRSKVAPAAINARKTHCKRGHDLSGPNIYWNHRGHRECWPCKAPKKFPGVRVYGTEGQPVP